MDEQQIVKQVAAAIRAFQVTSSEELARIATTAHRAALREAGFVIVPQQPDEWQLHRAHVWSKDTTGVPIDIRVTRGVYKAMVGDYPPR